MAASRERAPRASARARPRPPSSAGFALLSVVTCACSLGLCLSTLTKLRAVFTSAFDTERKSHAKRALPSAVALSVRTLPTEISTPHAPGAPRKPRMPRRVMPVVTAYGTPDMNDPNAMHDPTTGANLVMAAPAQPMAIPWSTLPFVPPKNMQLSKGASVTATFGASTADAPDRVSITLTANATVLYVVLTTSAQGRFSDNVLTIRSGVPKVVDFISWDGPLNQTGIAHMKSTLRVEHLAENS